MAVRILLVLAVLAVLYGCGQESSPAGKQEKHGGVEEAQPKTVTPAPDKEEETTTVVAGNMPTTGQQNEVTAAGGQQRSGGAGDQQQEAQQVANGKITFLRSTSDTGSTIYEMNPDGTGVTNITDPSLDILSAGISPNGEKIAFATSGTYGLYMMNADGTDRTRIFHKQSTPPNDLEAPVFSPDGKRIAFLMPPPGGVETEIYVVNADGTSLTRLTNMEGDESGLVWSPNGEKIAFVNTREEGGASASAAAPEVDLYVADADSTNETQITNTFTPESSPTWSPDGKKIAFARGSDPNLGSANDIFVINADGSNETNLTETADAEYSPVVWSPDGDKIAFVSTSDYSVYNVCVMN